MKWIDLLGAGIVVAISVSVGMAALSPVDPNLPPENCCGPMGFLPLLLLVAGLMSVIAVMSLAFKSAEDTRKP